MDENLAASSGAICEQGEVPRTPSSVSARPYGSGALAENQPRISDLLPKRFWTLACLQLLGLAAWTGVLAAFGYFFVLAPSFDSSRWTAFDLARGSVASWLGSSLLMVSGLLSLFVYSIRKHRADDYRGRYSVWIWMSGVLLLASIDASAGLHHILTGALTDLLPPATWGREQPWWILAYCAAVLVRGDRLLFELRRFRAVLAWGLLTLAAYATAAATEIGVFPLAGPTYTMTLHAAFLGGHLATCFTVLLYARYVFLEAQGVLQQQQEARQQRQLQKQQKRDQQKQAREERSETADRQRQQKAERKRAKRTDLDPPPKPEASPSSTRPPQAEAKRSTVDSQAQQAAARSNSGKKPSAKLVVRSDQPEADEDTTPDADATSASRKLSKAERRRLRKNKKKSRQAA